MAEVATIEDEVSTNDTVVPGVPVRTSPERLKNYEKGNSVT